MPATDRAWPAPSGPHVMHMTWHDLAFLHWAFDPKLVAPLLPPGIQPDTWEGRAYVGVIPFRMSGVTPRGIPALPGFSAFPEINVRTYVSVNGKPGVWFLSLDATHKIAVRVARKWFHLPYMDARMYCREAAEEWIEYSSTRTHRNEPHAEFRSRYRPIGAPYCAAPESLDSWLTSRYCLYAASPTGQIFRGEIDHPPWTLYQAEFEIESNTMLAPFGLQPQGLPHALFSKKLITKAWRNQPCSTETEQTAPT